MVSETLKRYIEAEILPRYDGFDAAHRRDHAEMVIAQSLEIARRLTENVPRSIYGKIVAEADRFIVPEKIIERTVQYGLEHYPELDREGHWRRTLQHMKEKYGDGGYLKLWFPESPNVQRLEFLRAIIRDEKLLREKFEEIYGRLI